MRSIRILLLAALLVPALPARAAADDQEGWQAFGHALALIQTLVRIGAQPNPTQAIDDVLAGRNTEANRAFAGLLEEATADMPPQYRDRMASIGRDFASLARKNVGRPADGYASAERPLQARKELTAMGLRYYDEQQFLDAVKRNDALAVELFVAGRGVNLSSRDSEGRSALEIARGNGNDGLADLLARSRPAAR